MNIYTGKLYNYKRFTDGRIRLCNACRRLLMNSRADRTEETKNEENVSRRPPRPTVNVICLFYYYLTNFSVRHSHDVHTTFRRCEAAAVDGVTLGLGGRSVRPSLVYSGRCKHCFVG